MFYINFYHFSVWLLSYISAVLNITAAPFQLADFIQVREQICEKGT